MSRPIISTEQLIKSAGQKRYEEGAAAFKAGAVRAFHFEKNLASAEIDGYQTQIRYVGEGIDGACNCEDSDGFDFCRHCVQLTLHANKVAQQLLSLSNGPDKSKVFAYLINLDKQTLAKQLLEFIEEDPDVFQRYLLKAAISQKGFDYSVLKSRITQLTKLSEKLFSQRQVKHFFARIDALLRELSVIPSNGEQERLLKLTEYAVQRMNTLLDTIEDRANQRQPIVEQLNQLYLNNYAALNGRLETRVKRFFQIWQADTWNILHASLTELSGDDDWYSAFLKLARQCWDSETVGGKQKIKIARFLMTYAKETGDFESEQMFRSALAKSTNDWIVIAEKWLEQGLPDPAIDILQEQLSSPNRDLLKTEKASNILPTLVRAYAKLPDGLSSLLSLFSEHPVSVWPALAEIAEAEDSLGTIRAKCIEQLQARNEPGERDLLLDLLCSENRLEEAFVLATSYEANLGLMLNLAIALQARDVTKCLGLSEKVLVRLLEKQQKNADKQAADLIIELNGAFAGRDEEALNDMLDRLHPVVRKRPNVVHHVRDALNKA